ncbi:carboxypeptidase-like regulatory domain-containing protein [Salinibacter pepae]|uniref:carboxypeptidase-like regulatory domain-containing protein n=1 Tax=Salinibacter pepae TaxID=3040382 RepID=UPI0021E81624|nr:carboxypeptidase-like regulatory domain-containing protein [Salinibacter pepae]
MQSSTSRVWFVLALFSLSILVSCDSGGGTPEPDEPSEVSVEVTGTVTSAENDEPIGGVSVEVLRADNGNTLASATTDTTGSYEATFTIEEPSAPDQIRLELSAEGFVDKEVSTGFQPSVSEDVTLEVMSVEATASGTVTDSDTGDPIEGASVTGTRPDGGEQLFEATTSSDGTYEATFEVADEPSEVTIQADDENFESGEQVVSFGQQITTDFSLQPATTEVTVSGTVSDSSSSDPIEGATITGTRVDDGDQLFETSAASSGEYESSFTVDAPSAPNELRVEANADSFRAEEKTVGFASSVSQDFELVKNRFSLDLSVDGDGSIETNLVSGDLSENGYLLGSEVEIEVLPNGENIFFGWSGDIDKSENPATIEITENTSATAEVGTPQDGLSLGIGLVQIGSTIDEASFSLSNDLPEEVIVTGFTLLDQNDTEVINTSDNLTIDQGDSSGFSVSFGIGPTPEEFEQYQTIWEFEFRGSTFEKEVVVGDVYSPSDPFSLDKSANMIELRVEE